MSKQIQVNWKIKVIIGACGGICVTVIRLIDANFCSQEIFLAIGDFDTSQNADGIGRKANKLLRDGCDTTAPSLLRNGVIVDGRTLFK